MSRATISSALLVSVALAAGSTAANDGPPLSAWLSMVQQDGADVIVSIKADYELGEITLNREGDFDPVEVFAGTIPNAEAADHETGCSGYPDEPWCEEHPTACWDCDGDGVDECQDPCLDRYRFDIVDECVYPGAVEYVLYEEGAEVDSEEIVVEDVGQDCPRPPGSGGGSGCSASGHRAGPGAPVALLMLIVGVSALAWRRRR
jgi:hypothetical protein